MVTHFSYIKVILKTFVEDGNDIILEEEFVHILSFPGGVAGTTAVLLDSAHLQQAAVSKKFESARNGFLATHEVCWHQHKIEIYDSSEISYPRTILQSRLDKPFRNEVNSTILQRFTS